MRRMTALRWPVVFGAVILVLAVAVLLAALGGESLIPGGAQVEWPTF